MTIHSTLKSGLSDHNFWLSGSNGVLNAKDLLRDHAQHLWTVWSEYLSLAPIS